MSELDSQKRGKLLVRFIWGGNLLLCLLIAIGIYWWKPDTGPREKPKPAEEASQAQREEVLKAQNEELPQANDSLPMVAKEKSGEKIGPALVLVVVGLGSHKNEAEWLKKVDYPLALSLVPMRPYSVSLGAMAQKRGWVTMAHIPMEPLDSNDIDHQACLISDMRRDELRDELTIKAIECIKRSDSQIDKKILIININLNKKYIIPNNH